MHDGLIYLLFSGTNTAPVTSDPRACVNSTSAGRCRQTAAATCAAGWMDEDDEDEDAAVAALRTWRCSEGREFGSKVLKITNARKPTSGI